MDRIPDFQERLDALSRRIAHARPGDGHAILVDMIRHLFQAQYGFEFLGESNLILSVINATLDKHVDREKAIHEALFVLVILTKDPPRRVEYDSRIRLIG
jgi:hypothetical protein